ncbi:MAG TPA: UDP-N-acetylmuramoyl-L-alanine--D-glutamate ligase [Syntrophorhabdales bacterium]|nr:UDP-N-acetylmuramoyl-L-alanine--D-glutamate ligase [Syntrophorhabdales bacterium]
MDERNGGSVTGSGPRTPDPGPGFDIPERVLVVGLGKTGVSLVKFLSGLGKKVTVTDIKSSEQLASSLAELNGTPYVGHFGSHVKDDFLDHEMILVSPGVDSNLALLLEARARGRRIIGEIELASRFIKEPIIAITGTNGKTTTTTLLGQVFAAAFKDVFVGGNIGKPLIDYVLKGQKARFVIAEISSFQLETIEQFRPHVAILLNITEDHLDRYTSFEEYVAAKWRLFENQTSEDYSFLTADLAGKNRLKARCLYFSTRTSLKEGAFLDGDALVVRLSGQEFRYRRDLSPLVGIHNSENLLAVLLTSHIYGIDRPVIEQALRKFKGLPHRMEFVREKNGVRFYNDSKATNVDATRRALESMTTMVVLIAGGKDKGGSYKVITELSDRIKGLVPFGEAKERIERELASYMPTHMAASLSEAVEKAFAIAGPGETVLFSPMCSSFDMFKDYKERGEKFRRIVEGL